MVEETTSHDHASTSAGILPTGTHESHVQNIVSRIQENELANKQTMADPMQSNETHEVTLASVPFSI